MSGFNVPDREIADVLDTAAGVIDAHGLVKGTYGEFHTGFCAVGALRVAARRRHPQDWGVHSYLAQRRIAEVVGYVPGDPDNTHHAVTTWSDAEHTHPSDVVDTMRAIAEGLR